ncbi:LolA-like outer membrane lipoprotein chaperone [Campylobacter concisus]|uniref:LolA-like outer membrane lipoprotein chaperone n=1 Tax=Campylobacter concisus TaxID=199 RepID=UPI000CD80F10|nr:LolA-like outer membrane lipoprotein chaperone [Campylobacter concisus]
MRKFLVASLVAVYSFGAGLNFKSLQSDFTQTVFSEGKSVNYKGRFYAKSDNTALWIYESPTPKRIYFDKDKVVVIEDELEQAIISRLDDTPNLTQVLAHAEQIQPTLYKAIYDGVEYFITIKNTLPTTIDYKDKLSNKIKITLSNPVKDALIPKETLTPVIPQGYDIVNQ